MRISIILSLTFLFSLLFLTNCGAVLAQEATSSTPVSTQTINLINTTQNPGAVEVGSSLIAPHSPLYFLKALREQIEMMIATKPEVRLQRQTEFATRRLREINTLIKAKRQDLIPSTVERYKLHINEVMQTGGLDQEVEVTVAEAIARHLDVLQRAYDQVGNERAKQAIRSAILNSENRIQLKLEKLAVEPQQRLINRIAERLSFSCRFLTREATASGLNDTERVFLREQLQKCRQNTQQYLKDQLENLRQRRMNSASSSATI